MRPPLNLETPISELYKYGIARLGQATSQNLSASLARFSNRTTASGITVEDLLCYLPMRYEDRSNLTTIRDLKDGMEASLELFAKVAGGYQVGKNRAHEGKPKLYIFQVTATDKRQGRPVVVWWFVSGAHSRDIIDYYMKRLKRGARFITFGKWELDERRGTFALRLQKPADELEMLPPLEECLADLTGENGDEADEADDPRFAAVHAGRRVPVYRKLGDLSSKRLREIIHALLDAIPGKEIKETLPAELRQRQKLIGRAIALREVHFPPDDANLDQYLLARSAAHRRLIFEDFFWIALGIALKRSRRVKERKGAAIRIDAAVKARIASVLPFKLTNAQRRVVKQIFADVQSEAPMNRLLQGDVGSGKTIVAVITMLATMESGYQTALMVPTEILAEQHARNIKKLLAPTPYRIELLTGSLKTAEKKRLQAELAAGEIHACIGTHALVQEAVSFKKLALAVIDEQHRFGVMQRAELRARGFNPDVLVMTATPIPRSLAMTVYGDLDVSVIDELPPGRTPIETKVLGEDQRLEVTRLLTREIKAGRQVYVVYPLVEESEKVDLRDATRRYEYLRDVVFPKYRVGLIHGRMKTAEKDDVMKRFVAGEVQILVSTTVIEVGVDVPNASVMVVEHAERFGLSQLHQLRGRVGRGAEKSYCLLLTADKRTAVAMERLGIMQQTSDGFLIAEKDLEIRGAGELLGTRQSGLPEFRVGNLVRDQQILEQARKEAEFYLEQRQRSVDTKRMIQRVQSDKRFGLAAVG